MAKNDTMQMLYIHELKDVYSAETQIAKALPKIIKAVDNGQLREALEEHLAETKEQRERIAAIVKAHGESPTGEYCKGMEGLLAEGDGLMEDFQQGPIRDAALISACQKVEHYEISAYGTLRTFAELLGHTDDIEVLDDILSEEENADATLTEIAVGAVNSAAAGTGDKDRASSTNGSARSSGAGDRPASETKTVKAGGR